MKWLNYAKIRVILIVFVAAIALCSGSAKADFTWALKTDMPIKRYQPSTSVVDGKIYVIGGWHAIGESHPQWELPTRVDVYEPATDTWTRKADIPTGRGHTGACVVDGKIYVIGGDPEAGAGRFAVEVYDPATDTWTQKNDMPSRRNWFSACEVDGIIYVIGGPFGGTHSTLVEAYDPVSDTWTRKADMFRERSFLATCVVDGLIYAIGGGAPGVRVVEVYDPDTDTWTIKAPMPTGRYCIDAVVVCGKIYVIGGWYYSLGGPIYSTVEVYDPVTNTWTSGIDTPVTIAGLSASVVDDKIYIMGGTTTPHDNEYWPLTSAVYANEPIVDFNGDYIVDIDDLVILIDNWGTDESLCDIGPMPWGDSMVNEVDLGVLMNHWGQDIRLAAHWKLDEAEGTIAYDSAGEHDGVLNGNPLWQPEGGMIDGALQFNGTDDYISTPFIINPYEKNFSVFAWIKGGIPGQVIISQQNGANWLLTDPAEGNLTTELKGQGRLGTPLASQAVIVDGDWHQVGVTWDGTNRILYVDDVEVASDTQSNIEGSEGCLYIGTGKNLEQDSFFSGLIDDVRIYNRTITP